MDIYVFHLSAVRLATLREGQYDLTDSSWVYVYDFSNRVQFFVPQMALAVGKNNFTTLIFSNQSCALVFMDMICWLGLSHIISTSFSIFVSGMYTLYHNFYCTFSYHLLVTKT
jgi:hypothetical protein